MATVQVSIRWTKNRASREAAPRAWEKTWEGDFSRNMYILSFFRGTILDLVPADLVSASAHGNNAVTIAREVSQVCQLQQSLAQMMRVVFPGGTIESQWRALSRARREEVVLAGIVNSFRDHWMEERREWCPETTLTNLTSRDGEEFLHIVRALSPATVDAPPPEPVHYPHPTIDRIFTPSAEDLQKPGCAATVRMFKMVRTYTITSVVWNVLHVIFGGNYSLLSTDPPIAVPTNVITPTPDAPQQIVPPPQADPRNVPGFLCGFCEASEASLSEGRKMQACSACSKVGRRVFYCSRECQTMDWKYGTNPKKHKEICGKVLD